MPDTFDSLRPRIIDYLYDRGIDPRKRFRCLNPSHLDRDPGAPGRSPFYGVQ